MPKIDIINYLSEGSIVTFPFAPIIVSKSITAENISIFEDLTCQLRLLKEDS